MEAGRIRMGVLSGIVLGGWESHAQGEGPDGSTRPAKETRAGRVRSDKHEPTSALASCVALPPASMQSSLRAIAYRLRTGNSVDLRGCEYNRGTGCGKTARPGLSGGRRVDRRSYRAS